MAPDDAREVLEGCPRRLLRSLVVNGSEAQQDAVWMTVYPVGCTVDHADALRIESDVALTDARVEDLLEGRYAPFRSQQ